MNIVKKNYGVLVFGVDSVGGGNMVCFGNQNIPLK